MPMQHTPARISTSLSLYVAVDAGQLRQSPTRVKELNFDI